MVLKLFLFLSLNFFFHDNTRDIRGWYNFGDKYFCGISWQQYQIYWERGIGYRDTAIIKFVAVVII